ncbi:polysaccharide lyase [Microbulbifer sp. EKSA008]|uniref:polysaccharide lyase n=2 Tax=unclassified Microbulbifer TaxID=2619833 RepID=UPI004042A482
MFSVFLLVTLFSFSTGNQDFAQMIGRVDRVEYLGGGLVVSGWACQKGVFKSVSVGLYLGGDSRSGFPLKVSRADQKSSKGIANICDTQGVPHGFKFYLNYEEMKKFVRKKIYVHGFSSNQGRFRAISNSGRYRVGIPYMKYTDITLLRRTFDLQPLATFDDQHLNLIPMPGDGYALEAQYIPYEKGSERISTSTQLAKSVSSATLAYDVKFHRNFEFVKGGKLHGLAGGGQASGCVPIDPKSWSVRVKFGAEGRVGLYTYHQDRVARCGDGYQGNDSFRFERDTWYRIELFVQLNSSANNADGYIELFINGKKIIEEQGLRLTGSDRVAIDKFQFSTFHGGSSALWSPSKKVYAYFDNISVKQGRKIYGLKGAVCENEKAGIYNGSGACCSSSCGACGGPGCGQLNGGSSACCTSEIINSAPLCSYPGQVAPCTM